MPTIANVIPFPPKPAPSRSSAAIASAVLDAGCGPEKAAWLVGDCKEADALFEEIVTVMATRSGFTSMEAYLAWAGCAAIWAASGPAS